MKTDHLMETLIRSANAHVETSEQDLERARRRLSRALWMAAPGTAILSVSKKLFASTAMTGWPVTLALSAGVTGVALAGAHLVGPHVLDAPTLTVTSSTPARGSTPGEPNDSRTLQPSESQVAPEDSIARPRQQRDVGKSLPGLGATPSRSTTQGRPVAPASEKRAPDPAPRHTAEHERTTPVVSTLVSPDQPIVSEAGPFSALPGAWRRGGPTQNLQRESELVRSARRALSTGHVQQAERWVTLYRAEHPMGQLRPEMAAVSVLIMCRRDPSQAESYVAKYRSEWPSSSATNAVEAGCVSRSSK